MKKREFKALALMGLTSGLLVSAQGGNAQESTGEPNLTRLATLVSRACGGPKGCGGAQKCGGPRGCGAAAQKCGGPRGCGAAAQKCGGPRGCGSLTADRDQPSDSSPYQSPDQKGSKNKNPDPNGGNIGYHLLSEDELMIELNEEGVKMYQSLTPEGKALALKVASMRCSATNDCKGLNACATSKNDCAGKGSCKGLGKCAISDKNLAVKLVYNKMMKEKRAKALDE